MELALCQSPGAEVEASLSANTCTCKEAFMSTVRGMRYVAKNIVTYTLGILYRRRKGMNRIEIDRNRGPIGSSSMYFKTLQFQVAQDAAEDSEALAALAPVGALAREVAVLFSSQETRRTREELVVLDLKTSQSWTRISRSYRCLCLIFFCIILCWILDSIG